jgi:hypothetical protein
LRADGANTFPRGTARKRDGEVVTTDQLHLWGEFIPGFNPLNTCICIDSRGTA